jgi:hypothetical protein
MTNRSFLVAALVVLAACRGRGDAAGGTHPAGTQPAPTTQHQAAPKTEADTLPSADAQPPTPAIARPRTYAECMATPGAASEAERERACMALPDAPK